MAPAFGVPSYHMASGYPGHPGGPGPSPMMGSLLGMHGGKPGGPGVPPHGPGLMAVGSPPGPSSPHFFLPPFPRELEERGLAVNSEGGSCGRLGCWELVPDVVGSGLVCMLCCLSGHVRGKHKQPCCTSCSEVVSGHNAAKLGSPLQRATLPAA